MRRIRGKNPYRQPGSSAPRPLSLLLLGLGRVGKKHLKALKRLRNAFHLGGLVSPHVEKARQDLKQLGFGDCPVYADLDQALAAASYDWAAIASPSGLHASQTRRCLEAGLHCLVEKPFCMDVQEAREVLELARERGRLLALGHIYRYLPYMRLLKEALAAGDYGQILALDFQLYWGHPASYYEQASWRGRWTEDGGILLNQSIHAVDLAQYLSGGQLVQAQAQLWRLSQPIEAEDFAQVQYQLRSVDGGLIPLTLLATSVAPEQAHEVCFRIWTSQVLITAGLKGRRPYIQVQPLDSKAASSPLPQLHRRAWKRLWQKGPVRSFQELTNPHQAIYQDIWDCHLDPSRKLRARGDDGLQSLTAILAAYESALLGRACPVPPDPKFQLRDMEGFFEA